MSTADRREQQIRERLAAATPGPWRWYGNLDTRTVQLTTAHSGVLTVMCFRRWGMQGAAPAFFRRTPDTPHGWNGRQEGVEDIAVREVPYRGDIVGLDNPNAELIANAPADLAYLLDALATVTEERNEWVTRAGHLASESAEAARELAAARRELEVSDRERDALLDDIEDYRRRLKATSDDYNEKANALAAAREENGRLREALETLDEIGTDGLEPGTPLWLALMGIEDALAREDGG